MKLVYDLIWEVDPFESTRRTLPDVSFVRISGTQDAERELADADVLVLSGRRYTEDMARIVRTGAPRLRWIQSAAVGIDLLVRHGVPDGILVTNAAGIKGTTVAEHGIALLLGLFHGLPQMERDRGARRWEHAAMRERVRSAEGMALLVAGYGSIGREVARKAKAFDMRVTAINRSGTGGPPADEVRPVARLDESLAEADAVVVALPYTEETRSLFAAPQFRAMKPSAVLVNIGRGGVVDERDLHEALASGRIAGAALDVFEDEPLPSDSPLWDAPNHIVSPHVANVGGPTYERFADLVVENIGRFLAGRPMLNVVALGDSRVTARADGGSG